VVLLDDPELGLAESEEELDGSDFALESLELDDAESGFAAGLVDESRSGFAAGLVDESGSAFVAGLLDESELGFVGSEDRAFPSVFEPELLESSDSSLSFLVLVLPPELIVLPPPKTPSLSRPVSILILHESLPKQLV
jgi:hypothetical protein